MTTRNRQVRRLMGKVDDFIETLATEHQLTYPEVLYILTTLLNEQVKLMVRFDREYTETHPEDKPQADAIPMT